MWKTIPLNDGYSTVHCFSTNVKIIQFPCCAEQYTEVIITYPIKEVSSALDPSGPLKVILCTEGIVIDVLQISHHTFWRCYQTLTPSSEVFRWIKGLMTAVSLGVKELYLPNKIHQDYFSVWEWGSHLLLFSLVFYQYSTITLLAYNYLSNGGEQLI